MSSQSGRLDHPVQPEAPIGQSVPPEAPSSEHAVVTEAMDQAAGVRVSREELPTDRAGVKEEAGQPGSAPTSPEALPVDRAFARDAPDEAGSISVPSEARPLGQPRAPSIAQAVSKNASGPSGGVPVLPEARPIDRAAAKKAFYQHGLVTLDQLRELGVSRKAMRVRLGRGQWVKAEPGVIRIAGSPITWESKVLACVLAAGEGAMASHRSAAALWGLEGFRRTGKPALAVPRNRRFRRASSIVHNSTDLDRVQSVRRDGIPTTPIGRTLLDLGAVTGRTRTLLAVDDARRKKLIDWEQLLHVLVTHARRGRDGVGTLRSILDDHFGEVAKTDSGFERLVLIRLAEAGLPKPVLQHEIQVRGRTYRIDLAYPARKLAIELDGGVHMRRDVRQRDYARQNALIGAGWRVLRFTWQQYRNDWPGIVREVRAALASPSPLP